VKNWEALRALTEGKAVRHSSWEPLVYVSSVLQFSSLTDLLPADGWDVHVPTHPWSWACEQLLAGRSVRRSKWNAGVSFRFNSATFLACYDHLPRDFGMAVLARADFEATDWMLA
jgi:hypothetical protein